MSKFSREYAAALYDLGESEGKQEEYRGALNTISDAFSKNPEFYGILSSLNIPIRTRENIVDKVFKLYLPKDVLSFLKLLCRKGRIGDFDNILNEYQKLYQKERALTCAKIVSAKELTQEEKEDVLKTVRKITGREITPVYETDESLIGGLIVYVDDLVIDGSVKTKLMKIKKATYKTP